MSEQQVSTYFCSLLKSSDKQNIGVISTAVSELNNKYAEGISQGVYAKSFKLLQNPGFDNKIPNQIEELKKELERVESQLGAAQLNHGELAVLKSQEFEKKVKEAAQLVERLKKERVIFKKKIKMIDVQNRLREKATLEMQKRQAQFNERNRIEQKRKQLKSRIEGIHQESVNRAQKMENFEKKYLGHIKSIINSNKRLYQRIQEQSKEKQKLQQERINKIMQQEFKKPTNWDLIRRHEKSYTKLAKQYVLHNQTGAKNNEDWKAYKFEYRSRSNPYLKRIEYKVPEFKPPRVLTQTEQQTKSSKLRLTKEDRIKQGNQFLAEAIESGRKQEGTKSQHISSSIDKKNFPNYLPEVKKDIREALHRLEKKITTQIDSINPQNLQKNDQYNRKILQNIKKLDSIVEKKIALQKSQQKAISQQGLDEQDDVAAMYIKSIKSKLNILNSQQPNQNPPTEPKQEQVIEPSGQQAITNTQSI